jgi:ribosome biogenesis GTPase
LARWRKLKEEDERNSETVAEARSRGRKFSKMAKSVMKAKRARRGE